MTEPISLRSLAKLLNVNEKAVRKGIARGRLQRSVARVGGRPVVVDADLAREEWSRNAARTSPQARIEPRTSSPQESAPGPQFENDADSDRTQVFFDGTAVVLAILVREEDPDSGWLDLRISRTAARALAADLTSASERTHSDID